MDDIVSKLELVLVRREYRLLLLLLASWTNSMTPAMSSSVGIAGAASAGDRVGLPPMGDEDEGTAVAVVDGS